MQKIRWSKEEQERQRRIKLETELREASQRKENDHNQGPPRAPLSLIDKGLLVATGGILTLIAAVHFGSDIKEGFETRFPNNPISKVFSLTFPSK